MGGLFRDAFAESAGSAGRRPGGLFHGSEVFAECAGSYGSAGRRPGGLCTFAESAGSAGRRPGGLFREAFAGGGRVDFAGKRSLSLLGVLGLLGGGRADFAGKRSLSLLGLLGGRTLQGSVR